MEFEEHGNPQCGVISQESDLLRLANEWDVMQNWGVFAEHGADISKTIFAIKSYLYQMEHKFSRKEDYFHLRGQDNILHYLPIKEMCIRLHNDDSLFETLARIAAARTAGCDFVVSVPNDLSNPVTSFLEHRYGQALLKKGQMIYESDEHLAEKLHSIDRIRYAAPERVPDGLFREAAKNGFFISRSPVYMEGHLELLHYFRQQSICDNYHRYGNLGERGELK